MWVWRMGPCQAARLHLEPGSAGSMSLEFLWRYDKPWEYQNVSSIPENRMIFRVDAIQYCFDFLICFEMVCNGQCTNQQCCAQLCFSCETYYWGGWNVHDFLRSILAFWEVDLHNVETPQEHVRGYMATLAFCQRDFVMTTFWAVLYRIGWYSALGSPRMMVLVSKMTQSFAS